MQLSLARNPNYHDSLLHRTTELITNPPTPVSARVQGLRLALENLSDAFITLDESWRFTNVNPQAERLLQKTHASLLGSVFWETFPASLGFQKEFARVLAENTLLDFEKYYAPLNIWFQVRAYPDAGGVSATFRDISRRVHVEREADELQKNLEERVALRTAELQRIASETEAFAYSIAHDLRTPLASINGFCHGLEGKEGTQLSPRGRHFVQRIGAVTRQMEDMIEGLLALARLSRAAVQREVVDLAPMATAILENLQKRDPQRQVEVQVSPDLWAEGDPTLLTQVLGNLLTNAWKFTAKKIPARIEVGMEMNAGQEPVYFVKDNGVGFDMAHAARLFEVFQRLHSAIEFEGTGVGLATVHKIIQRHDGRIWAESASGQGAKFCFCLAGGAILPGTPAATAADGPQ